MPIDTIDRKVAAILRDDAIAAVKRALESYSVDVEPASGGSFSPEQLTISLVIRVRQTADGRTGEKAEFERLAATVGLRPEDYGRTFSTFRGEYRAVAIRPKNFKCPLIAERNGKRFKFPAHALTRSAVPSA